MRFYSFWGETNKIKIKFGRATKLLKLIADMVYCIKGGCNEEKSLQNFFLQK